MNYVIQISAASKQGMPYEKFESLTRLGWHVVAGKGWVCAATDPLAIIEDDILVIGVARLTQGASAISGQQALRQILEKRRDIGPGFAEKLHGAFSFVIHDQTTHTTTAYRDAFGVYPIYYSDNDAFLTIGIDPKATLHIAGIPIAPNPVRIADFIVGEEVDATQSSFVGLSRLAPGHRLNWNGKRQKIHRDWHPPHHEVPPLKSIPEQLQLTLRDATQACLNGDNKVGSMLSGGLDSSAISGLAAQIMSQAQQGPLKTLSFVYDAGHPYDETRFIAACNDMFRSDPVLIPVEAPPDLDQIDDLIEEQFELFLAPGLQKSRTIYSVAKQNGLHAILDGHGGDETISHGFARLVELSAKGQLVALWLNMRGVARIHHMRFFGQYLFYIARYGPLKHRGLPQRVIMKIARMMIKPQDMSSGGRDKADLLTQDIRAQIEPDKRYAVSQDLKTRADFLQAESIAHRNTLETPLIAHGFEVLHRAGAAAGIEPRYPFYDQALVSFCLAAPSAAKLQGGQTRWMLRKAMKGLMPQMVCNRTDKADFTEEMGASVKAFFYSKTDQDFEHLAPYVNLAQFKDLRARLDEPVGPSNSELGTLWRISVLSKWVPALHRWQQSQSNGKLMT